MKHVYTIIVVYPTLHHIPQRGLSLNSPALSESLSFSISALIRMQIRRISALLKQRNLSKSYDKVTYSFVLRVQIYAISAF